MIDGVVLLRGIARNERHARRVGERLDIVQWPGQADEAGAEIIQILFQLLGRVALGVDADQDRLISGQKV